MIRGIAAALLAMVMLVASIGGVLAQKRTPVLMEGKQRLFQRVLVRERTVPLNGPNGSPAMAELAPLQPLYIYARDGSWIEAGPSDTGDMLFWLPADTVVDWHQNIVATFDGSENVGRVLFFQDLDSVYDVVEAESPATVASGLREEAVAAETGGAPSETVVALGPREAVDQRANFYVMPILESEEAIFENGAFTNLLKVAVARAEPGGAEPKVEIPTPAANGARDAFRAAVVFVVDTTSSMQPYIDATLEALADIYQSIMVSSFGDAVSFGIVGYRDNLAGAPDLDYAAKTFVSLRDGSSVDAVLEGISRMKQAEASSRNFREDSYFGIDYALRYLDWSEFGARFIVLVTDAGPREFGDELSATGLSASGLATIIQDQLNGVVTVLHLKTEAGSNDHASAESAYRTLTSRENNLPLYFPVEGGDRGIYRTQARKLGQTIVEQVAAFRGGEDFEDFADEDADAMTKAIRSAGRTMQLAYLGRVQGTAAPDVFEAYVSDRDFDRTGLKPLSIRVLLNKNQLSDLNEALQLVIDQAEANILNPDEFFDQVLGAAADMSRSPDDVSRRADSATLAEAAFIDEYLEGLPYKSRIMNVTEDDWVRMSVPEQEAITNELYDKLSRYRRYNEATDQWVDYLGTGTADARLYPMKLDDLP